MINFTSTEYEKLMVELNAIQSSADNELQKANQSFQAVRSRLNLVKVFILGYQFKDCEEEIMFFKEIKPRFLRELIYFDELHEIEANRPFGSDETLILYYNNIIGRIGVYFSRNQYLYNCYLIGSTNHDNEYFLRDTAEVKPDAALEIDPRFCTVYSYKLSKLMAFEKVKSNLQKRIYELEHPSESSMQPTTQHKSQWTDSKVALIELAYALQSRGSIDNGKLDVKQVIGMFEKFFNIDLGNYYGVFQQNIRIRKKSRTVYLDQLKEYLERRMDASDENPRYG